MTSGLCAHSSATSEIVPTSAGVGPEIAGRAYCGRSGVKSTMPAVCPSDAIRDDRARRIPDEYRSLLRAVLLRGDSRPRRVGGAAAAAPSTSVSSTTRHSGCSRCSPGGSMTLHPRTPSGLWSVGSIGAPGHATSSCGVLTSARAPRPRARGDRDRSAQGRLVDPGVRRRLGRPRPMYDVDVLVPFARAREAIEMLERQGWCPEQGQSAMVGAVVRATAPLRMGVQAGRWADRPALARSHRLDRGLRSMIGFGPRSRLTEIEGFGVRVLDPAHRPSPRARTRDNGAERPADPVGGRCRDDHARCQELRLRSRSLPALRRRGARTRSRADRRRGFGRDDRRRPDV